MSHTIATYYGLPFSFNNLEDMISFLDEKSDEEETFFIIDEFTYLLEANKGYLSVLQNINDSILLNSKLKLILSGSHVGMIEDALTY